MTPHQKIANQQSNDAKVGGVWQLLSGTAMTVVIQEEGSDRKGQWHMCRDYVE